jgi:hypothetical protein
MSSTLSQPAQPTRAPFVVPTTLKDFNACLAHLGLSRLEPMAFATLRARESRDRLVEALRRALHGDTNALVYLRRVTGTEPVATIPAAPAASASRSTLRLVPSATVPTPVVAPVEVGQVAAPPAAPSNPATSPSGHRSGLHVYGQQGALTIEADQTRDGFHTLALDAAHSNGPRQFDWEHKLRLQVTRQELPVVTAVLAGILPGGEFNNHGPDNNKGFSLQQQPDRGVLFCRVFTKGRVIAVPIGAQDAYYVTTLALRQLCANTPWLTATEVLKALQATVGRLKVAQARPRSPGTPTG